MEDKEAEDVAAWGCLLAGHRFFAVLRMTTVGEKRLSYCVCAVFCSLLDWGRLKDMPGAEDFGNGPGLGDATLRGKRWLSV
ncbi:MAG: hypothetical protein ABI618_20225, partial [Nitrospirota bacterium]